MAESDSSGGSTGIVAIFAILLVIIIAAFLAWRAGIFGDGSSHETLDINVNTPSSNERAGLSHRRTVDSRSVMSM